MARTGRTKQPLEPKIQLITQRIVRKCSPVTTGIKRRIRTQHIVRKQTPVVKGPQCRQIFRFFGINALNGEDVHTHTRQFYAKTVFRVQQIWSNLVHYKNQYMYGALNQMVKLQQTLLSKSILTPQLRQKLQLIIPPRVVLNVYFSSLVNKIKMLPVHLNQSDSFRINDVQTIAVTTQMAFVDRCWDIRSQLLHLLHDIPIDGIVPKSQRTSVMAHAQGIVTWIQQLNQPLLLLQKALLNYRERAIKHQIYAEQAHMESQSEDDDFQSQSESSSESSSESPESDEKNKKV